MASTSGGSGGSGHGGKRHNAGRKTVLKSPKRAKKEWEKRHKRIYLEEKVFQTWIRAKFDAGYQRCSDSVFAGHLLSLEYRRRILEDNSNPASLSRRAMFAEHMEVAQESTGPTTSTPLKPLGSHVESSDAESPVCFPVDTETGMDSTSLYSPTSQVVRRDENMSFRLNTSLFSDDEVNVDDMDESNSEDNVSYKHLFNSAILDLNAEDSTFADDSDTESGTFMNNSDDHSSASDSEVPVSEACDDDDDDDDGEEEEKTINEAVEQTLNVQPLATHSVPEGPQCGPHFKLSRGEELYAYEKELQLVKEKKFICSLGLFLDLFVKRCPVLFCNYSPNVKHHFVGPTLVVHTTCQAGHRYSFASSHEVNGMYVNNLQCASALFLSGNNYSKISRMAEFLNLNFISESTYYRMQRLYLVPAVEEWWCWMRGELIKEFEGQKIVVGGDGQCDSPGFSAKNLCYFLMEITTSYILEVEVRDKRHVGLTSTKMEKEALKNALERLKSVLDVVELATDASASIKKLIEINFKDVFHSLDVWHKSKSIRKCLAKDNLRRCKKSRPGQTTSLNISGIVAVSASRQRRLTKTL